MANYITIEQFTGDKAHTCCFTGHRNRDLPFSGDLSKPGMRNLISTVQMHIAEAYKEGFRYFITGVAEGVDIICGSIMLDMMGSRLYSGMKMICAMPYMEQRREIKDIRERYIHSILLKKAECVVVTGKVFDKGRYRVRNQFMVDNSSRLIAVYKQKPTGSGTLQTINMARRAGLGMRIVALDDNPLFYMD